jgi:hypothetical protein
MSKLQKYNLETRKINKQGNFEVNCSAVTFYNAGSAYVMINNFKLKPEMTLSVGDSCATDQIQQVFDIRFNSTGTKELYVAMKTYLTT